MTIREILELAKVRRWAKTGEARRIRHIGGLSLSEVAEAVGVSGPAVSRWESGQRRPTGRAGLAYAQLLSAIAVQEEGTPVPKRRVGASEA